MNASKYIVSLTKDVWLCVYLPFQAAKPQVSLNKIKPELEIHIWKENLLIEG